MPRRLMRIIDSTASRPGRRSPVRRQAERQPMSRKRGPLVPFDLDPAVERHSPSALLVLFTRQLREMAANSRSARHRRDQPYPVKTVIQIDPIRAAAQSTRSERAVYHMRQQRNGQEPEGDCVSERAVLSRSNWIDVQRIGVERCCAELVDHRLSDSDLLGNVFLRRRIR